MFFVLVDTPTLLGIFILPSWEFSTTPEGPERLGDLSKVTQPGYTWAEPEQVTS
jgi:hypothetical protein